MNGDADQLRGIPYFADLEDVLLEEVAAKSRRIELGPGETIIEEGTLSNEMYAIVEGTVRVVKDSAGRRVDLAHLHSGDVVGEIAVLDAAPRTATVVTETDTVLIEIPSDAFEVLLRDPAVVRRMFKTVTERLRGIEMTLRHEERMSALGRMAAQLMHELNNPASAVGRSTELLVSTTEQLIDHATQLTRALTGGVDLSSPGPTPELSPLARSDREGGLVTYLESLELEDGWDYAAAMVDAGWTGESLAAALVGADPELRPGLARWTGLRSLAVQLTSEIALAASRVSELVRVVKDYSFVDQAPVQEVDIVKGISDTLVLLKPKLRGIEVATNWPPDGVRLEAPGRDLNQVWTNLIDNAAHAMEGDGVLSISVEDGERIISVTITDTGGGMDAETATRIFDPFFTTKAPGQGTGLGLYTVHNIVTRIGGEISVSTSDTGTTFEVTLIRP